MGIIVEQTNYVGPDPVATALSRLDTAQRRYDVLERGWRELVIQSNPRLEPRVNPFNNRVESIARGVVQPTAEMNDEARYCASEARSALDNLIFGMASHAGTAKKDLGGTAFPLAPNEGDWAAWSPRMLAGLPDDVVERVRAAQPFMAGKRPPLLHPLKVLAKLANDDKHRQPLRLGQALYLPPNARSLLTTMSLEFPNQELVDRMTRQHPDPDKMIDVRVTPIEEGDVVVAIDVPPGAQAVSISMETLGMSLVAHMHNVPVPGPLLPQLVNIMRLCRQTIAWVGGQSDEVPDPWPEDFVPPPRGED